MFEAIGGGFEGVGDVGVGVGVGVEDSRAD